MHFTPTTIIAVLATASLTAANPAFIGNAKRNAPVCTGAASTPNCCAVNVLNAADLQCSNPPWPPTSVSDFTKECADIGQEAQCCTLDALGQALLCSAP